jgi:hypothetical protein
MARFTSADDNRQSYTSRSPTSKSTSKTTTSSGGGGGDNNRENYRNTPAAKASAKKAATISKANKIKNDATAYDNYKYTKKFTPSILGMTLNVTGLAEKGFYANKSYYEKNVIGKNNFTKSIDSLKDYMSKRGSGEIDAMGRAISGGGNGGNTQPGITKNIGGSTIQTTAPTTAEVSQSEAANADAAALKVKKRGRSQSIMTSSQGVTKTSPNYSLGKKSLLGRV